MRTLSQLVAGLQLVTLYLLMLIGGIAAGAYCLHAAYEVGSKADWWLGISLGAIAIISWGMLPWADVRGRHGAHIEAWVWRLCWVGLLGIVIVTGVSYAAHYRTQQTGSASLKIESYEDASAKKKRLEADLELLKTNPRWKGTNGCTSATAEASIAFCAKVEAAAAAIGAAEAIKAQGRPASADAGVETVAWITGADKSTVARSIPLSWALASDLIASLCLKSLLSAPKRRPEDKNRGAAPKPVQLHPVETPKLDAPEGFKPQAVAGVNAHAKALADKRWAVAGGKQKVKRRARV